MTVTSYSSLVQKNISNNKTKQEELVQKAKLKQISYDNTAIDTPALSSGGRTFITILGKPVAVCQDFSYSVSIDTEEVRTIDSQLPWDIIPGQIKISGKLTRFIDPESSLETEGMLSTMQANLHQPYVELLITDADGNPQFFCKGMFTAMDAKYTTGQLAIASATFTGVQYQHFVFQEFDPYPTGPLKKANDALTKVKKTLGGFGL